MSLAAGVKKILVVGGNGFIGKPYTTPKGHSPAWTSRVNWQKGDALEPQTFSQLFDGVGGVVHTLGTLLEDGAYKRAIREGNLPGLISSLLGTGKDSNPLQRPAPGERKGGYERLNRDSALRVCEAFVQSKHASTVPNEPRPFVYVSAEDIFRPVIPSRYIETKREAEQGIEEILRDKPDYRGVHIRPGLVYHAHLRPLTTPVATVLDISAAIHRKIPASLPTPSSVIRSIGTRLQGPSSTAEGSSAESIANALTIPPIHVDQVAAAIVAALDSSKDVRGVVGVPRMRELIGWRSE